MKRLVTIVILVLIVLLSQTAFAQNETVLFYDNAKHIYTAEPITLEVEGEEVVSDVMPVILEGRTLVPARAIFEKLGGVVRYDEAKKQISIFLSGSEVLLTINSKTAYVNRKSNSTMPVAPKIINDRTMIPLRFASESLGLLVDWNEKERKASVKMPANGIPKIPTINILSVKSEDINSGYRISINSDKPINEYKSFVLKNPDRIVLDIYDAILSTSEKDLTPQNSLINKVRFSQFEVYPKITRVVIDLSQYCENKVYLSQNKSSLLIDFNIKKSTVKSIIPAKTATAETVNISMIAAKKPNMFMLTSPNRLVLDFDNCSFETKPITTSFDGTYIKGIRSAVYNEKNVRVVIDLNSEVMPSVELSNGGVLIKIIKPTYQNVEYSNSDGSKLILNGIINDFNEAFDPQNNKIILSTKNQGFGEGVIYINDSLIKSIEIEKKDGSTNFIILTKSLCKFEIAKDDLGNKTNINITPVNNANFNIRLDDRAKNKLVVIDAGHGGKDPGAIGMENGIIVLKEKDVNLDITLRLNEMLKSFGVKTYLTRQDDTFVDLFERPQRANELNATLFISVHNNAMQDTSVSGTEVLYYGDDDLGYKVSGKRLAELTLSELANELNLKSRGIKKSPKMVVLNKTKMPSIIVENAFLTNDEDRNFMKTDEFRQKAAKGLCIAIIMALNESVN